MFNKFCTQTARKLRKFGYIPKVAAFYSRFFYLSMLSVSGIVVISMRHRKGMKLIGDETPRFLRRKLACLIAGLAAVDIVPASSRIHRN